MQTNHYRRPATRIEDEAEIALAVHAQKQLRRLAQQLLFGHKNDPRARSERDEKADLQDGLAYVTPITLIGDAETAQHALGVLSDWVQTLEAEIVSHDALVEA